MKPGFMVRCALAGCAVAAALLSGGASAASGPTVPLADFFKPPKLGTVALSPSGRYLAVQVMTDNGRMQLAVQDLDGDVTPRIVAGAGDIDVGEMHWINDKRLLFYTVDLSVGPYDWRSKTQGWWSVNRDGSRLRKDQFDYQRDTHPIQFVGDASNNVIATRTVGPDRDKSLTLWSLDTLTGYDVELGQGAPAGVMDWIVDEAGHPRALLARKGNRETLYRHDEDNKRWVAVLEQPLFGAGTIQPLLFREGQMYVLATRGEDRTRALYRYDLDAAKLADAPLAVLDGYDFRGSLVFDAGSREVIGIRHLTDEWGTTWLAPEMKALQQRIDALLPGRVNEIHCRQCLNARRVVVATLSDRSPVAYGLYDLKTGELQSVGRSRTWISAQQMGERRGVTYTARDGLVIPMTITSPAGARDGDAPRPAVVLIHGGPWLRGNQWGWSAEAQFLASRGYLVLEPEFRGSAGYGERLLVAGNKQWGLAMQDDIADAARWAVDHKLVDPQRVCLAGASYGGYATLMGLVRHPAQFRCGVSWVAPTDIDLMFTSRWSDISDTFRNHGLTVLVGDRERDAKQLRETSPLHNAARITQPLLLAYGLEDKRVPIEHGERLRDALRPHNPKLEWVVYRTEGHGFFLLDNQLDFWGRVERFLAAQLQGGSN